MPDIDQILQEQLLASFKKRVIHLRNENDWTNEDLAHRIGHDVPKTIENWLTPSYQSLPHITWICRIAEAFGTSVGDLLGLKDPILVTKLSGDSVVTIAGEKYDDARRQVVKSATKRLSLQLRAGGTLHGNDSIIPTLRDALNGKPLAISLLIGNPRDDAAVEMIALRRGDISKKTIDGVKSDIEKSILAIQKLVNNSNSGATLEIRVISYLVPSLVYIADAPIENDVPDTGAVVALIANFGDTDLRNAPMIHSQSSDMVKFFTEDFDKLWKAGTVWQEQPPSK